MKKLDFTEGIPPPGICDRMNNKLSGWKYVKNAMKEFINLNCSPHIVVPDLILLYPSSVNTISLN